MEEEIFKIATKKIDELIGIECKITKAEMYNKNKFVDAEIVIKQGNTEILYLVEVKRKIVPDQVPRILDQNDQKNPTIYLVDYITPTAKELLRLNNIPYVDTAGNMFLNNQHLYIYIQTDKTNRKKLKTHTKAFNKAGLKVIYQFLKHPEYINKPYRFIGKKAKVTIATVGNVLKDLLKEKYIVQVKNRTYKFLKRNELFEEWVKEYNRNLKPKLKTKRYKWLKKNKNWRNVKLPLRTLWGGPNAAEILTEYLIADKIEIYTGLEFQEVINQIKIIPDNEGEITLTETFWEVQDENTDNTVDPMIIYADLLNNTNPRYLETAQKIYKEHVQDKL